MALTKLSEINPTQIIPQREPFIMIDCLTHYDDKVASTRLTVRHENLFVVDKRLIAPGIIENMAQTCAARIGYYNLISGLPIKIGFIGGISNLSIFRLPEEGEVIDTVIRVSGEVFGMTIVEAETRSENELLASAVMKISIK